MFLFALPDFWASQAVWEQNTWYYGIDFIIHFLLKMSGKIHHWHYIWDAAAESVTEFLSEFLNLTIRNLAYNNIRLSHSKNTKRENFSRFFFNIWANKLKEEQKVDARTVSCKIMQFCMADWWISSNA